MDLLIFLATSANNWIRTYVDVVFGIIIGTIFHIGMNRNVGVRTLFWSTIAGILSALLLTGWVSGLLRMEDYDHIVGAIIAANGTATFVLVLMFFNRKLKEHLGDDDDADKSS